MNLPILGTVSALFSNANEELKKLLQPWAIFSAVIFLGLGLLLIYLPVQHRFPLPSGWIDLGSAEKVVIGSGVVLSVAYLIRGLGGFFLTLAGGRWLRRSPIIGRVLVYWQLKAYRRLIAETKAAETPAAETQTAAAQAPAAQAAAAQAAEGVTERRNRAFYRLAYEYPTPVRLPPKNDPPNSPDLPSTQSTLELLSAIKRLRDKAKMEGLALVKDLRATDDLVLAPTRLANVRAAVSSYSMNQYGAHLDTIWPALNQTLGKEDDTLLKQMEDAQTTTTFLATLAVLLVVLAVIAAPVGLLVGDGRRLGAAVALLPVAYVFYHAAVARALAWTRLIRAALDLYLDETGERLGLRKLDGDPEKARDRWRKVSHWLAYGGMKLNDPAVQTQPVDADWYKEATKTPPLTVTPSAGVTVAHRVTERPPAVVSRLSGPGRLPCAGYTVTLMAGRTPDPAAPPYASSATAGGFVMVSDSRIPMLPGRVTGQIHWPNGAKTPTPAIVSRDDTGPDALLWSLPDLARQGSTVLTYTIAPAVWLWAGPDVKVEDVAPLNTPDGMENGLRIRLLYTANTRGPVKVFAAPVVKERAGEGFVWSSAADSTSLRTGSTLYDPSLRRVTWLINNVAAGSRLTLQVTLQKHGLTHPRRQS